MALNREQHNRIMRVYQERRFQHLQERRQRAEEISLKLPSYDRLSEEAAQLRTEQAKSLLSHDGSRAEALAEKFGCAAVIHMDPLTFDDSKCNALRSELTNIAQAIDPKITIHDLRIVEGPTHTNVIFDAVVPFEFSTTDEQVREKFISAVRQRHPYYNCVINIDKPYI